MEISMTMTAALKVSEPEALNPGSLEFQEFTGIEYLKIDLASNFGLDKESWQARIDWVDVNETQLEGLVQKAEEPALFYAGLQAYRKAQRGLPTGYPVSLDATASGLQLLAVLSGCEASARLCNVVPTGRREDAYTNIYQAMCEALGTKAKITRGQAKDSIMTSLYGSQAVPKRHFGTGEVLDMFYRTMNQKAPGAWKLNKILLSLWQPFAKSHDWVLPDNYHVHIKVMNPTVEYVQFDGFPLPIYLQENKGSKEGLSIGANLIHSIDGMIVREMTRRCSYDLDMMLKLLDILTDHRSPWGSSTHRSNDRMVLKLWENYRKSGFLSVRILEHLDTKNMGLVDASVIEALIKTMPEKPFDIISIHDCWRCLPSYANQLRRQYNQILSDLAQSEILSFLASQITGSPVTVIKAQDISQIILKSNYALS
jgi:hypothetical protein